MVDASMEDRIPDALSSTKDLVAQAVKRLQKSGFVILGAAAGIKLADGTPKNIDVRLRWTKAAGKPSHLVLCELKYSASVRSAQREANKHWATLEDARKGHWIGPHPKAGKSAKCRYVGTIALSPRTLRQRIKRHGREV